jgi:hypothetical protein
VSCLRSAHAQRQRLRIWRRPTRGGRLPCAASSSADKSTLATCRWASKPEIADMFSEDAKMVTQDRQTFHSKTAVIQRLEKGTLLVLAAAWRCWPPAARFLAPPAGVGTALHSQPAAKSSTRAAATCGQRVAPHPQTGACLWAARRRGDPGEDGRQGRGASGV